MATGGPPPDEGMECETPSALEKSFELSPEMQCVINWNGLVQRINPAFAAQLGHVNKDLLGRQFAQLCHPEDRAIWQHHMATAQAVGQSASRFSCRVRTAGGVHLATTWHLAADTERRLLFAFGRPAGPSLPTL